MGLRWSSSSRSSANNHMSTPPEIPDNSGSAGRQANLRSSGSPPSEDESFAALLSYLIRSGQMRLITRDSPHSGEESGAEETTTRGDVSMTSGNDEYPRTGGVVGLDTSGLKMNDIYPLVSLTSGDFSVRSCKRAKSVALQMSQRQYNRSSIFPSFTQGEKCRLTNTFLPNRMEKKTKCRSKIFCGQYTQDGNMFVSACQDHKMRFYDTRQGRFNCVNEIEARDVGWSVIDVAVSPDGNHVIYSSWSDYIHQCAVHGDANHVAFNLIPRDHRFCVFSVRFSSDGKDILAGASDRCLYVYDREKNERTLRISSHEDDVNNVAFADITSQILFSGGDDGLVKVWDRRTLSEEKPSPVGVFGGHMDGITFIDSKGDARYLISNSKDQSIKLWDLRKFSDTGAIQATKRAVASQSWDYRWQSVPRKVLAQRNSNKLPGDTSVMTYSGHTVLHTLIRSFFSPQFSTGQRYIYTGCASGSCIVYDLLTGEMVSRLRGHMSCVRDVAWHPYQNEIVTSSWDGVLGLWSYSGRRAAAADDGSCSDTSDNEDKKDEDDDDGDDRQKRTRMRRKYLRNEMAARRQARMRDEQRRAGGAIMGF